MGRRDRRKSNDRPLTRAQQLNHLKAKALEQAAHAAWGKRLPYKTIALLSEALQREPKNLDVLLSLAKAYGLQKDYDQAEELLGRALKLAPSAPSVLRRVGQAYSLIDREEQAIACYQHCLVLEPDPKTAGPALRELAHLLERRHLLEEARAAVDRALALDPEDGEALVQRALLERRQGDGERAEATLRAVVDDARRSLKVRVDAGHQLAQILDERDFCDEAMAALVAAKRLLAPHTAPMAAEARRMNRKCEVMLAQLDHAWFDRARRLAEEDSPYRTAILTGHPRSGTTLVEQVLDAHADAVSADELDVFSQWIYEPLVRKFPPATPLLTVFEHVPPAIRQEARATYLRQTESALNQPLGARLLVDKNPPMTMLLPLVNWAFPEMKVLFALRDPRDVVLSCYMQRVGLNSISVNWLSLEGTADCYARTMRTWLAVKRWIHAPWIELRYEDVVADMPGQARRILDFLGLPWDEKVLRYYEHAREKPVRSPTYADVTKPIYQGSVGRWRRYSQHLEPLFERLQPLIEEFGYAES